MALDWHDYRADHGARRYESEVNGSLSFQLLVNAEWAVQFELDLASAREATQEAWKRAVLRGCRRLKFACVA